MSHQFYNPTTTRLQRSELAVPGSSPKMFEKALNSNADYIFLDLEDAVSPNDKQSARENIIKALNEINWREKGKTISVRINSLDTHYMYRDVVDIMEQVGNKIDTILVPKVGTSSDVYMVDCLLTQIENQKKLWWEVHKEDHEICERLQLGRASPVSCPNEQKRYDNRGCYLFL